MPPLKKNKIIINSDMIKVVVASYYRFKMRYFYTCTEYEHYDICACNGKYLTEIEVKISYSDLVSDTKKIGTYSWGKDKDGNSIKTNIKLKHDFYSGKHKSKYILVPNYFYYCLSYDLYMDKRAVEYIEEHYPQYGIMYVQDWREPIITKRPTMLNKNKVGENILNSILMRISSENIGLRKKLYELKLSIKK
jgi:hypothetical protein